jgi:hypothetical protein
MASDCFATTLTRTKWSKDVPIPPLPLEQTHQAAPPLRIFDPEADSYAEWSAQVELLRQQLWTIWREEPLLRETDCVNAADRSTRNTQSVVSGRIL